jgi:hypothetical protein
MEATPISEVRRGDVVRFHPENSRYRVMVLVDSVSFIGRHSFIHGIRSTAEGIVDSQSRRHAWPFALDGKVEVLS